MEVNTRRVRVRQAECAIAQQALEVRVGGQRLQRLVESVLQIRHRQVEALGVAGVQHEIQAQLLGARIIATRQRYGPETERAGMAGVELRCLQVVHQRVQGGQRPARERVKIGLRCRSQVKEVG